MIASPWRCITRTLFVLIFIDLSHTPTVFSINHNYYIVVHLYPHLPQAVIVFDRYMYIHVLDIYQKGINSIIPGNLTDSRAEA